MTTVALHIRSLILLACLISFYGVQSQEVEPLKEIKQDFVIVLGGNVGSAIPFPFYHIPEERHANMMVRPYIGFQYNREIGDRMIIRIGHGFSQKAVEFSATLVDQPYNGYVEYELSNGNTAKGEVEDAYFNGHTNGNFNLRYYEFNSSIGRRLGKRSTLYSGIYGAYLFKSENKVFVDGSVSLGPGLEPISKRFQRSEDYSDMFRKWDFGFQLGYERQVLKRLCVNAFFSSSLRSIYKPELEAVSYTMLNMYACVGITYHLFEGLYPQE